LLLVLLVGLMLITVSTYMVFAPEPESGTAVPEPAQALLPAPAQTSAQPPITEPESTPTPTPEPTPTPTPETVFVEARRAEILISINEIPADFLIYEINERIFLNLFEVASVLSNTEKRFLPEWDEDGNTLRLTGNSLYTGNEPESAYIINDALTAVPVDISVYFDENIVSISAYSIAGDILFDFYETAGVLDLIIHQDSPEDAINVFTNLAFVDIFERKQRIDPSLPMVALTFDDGPGNLTNQILDILEQHDAVATFYVIGMQIEAHSDTILRAFEMGCEIANHTWSHRSLERISENSIRTQLQSTCEAIESVIGIPPSSIRPPFGRINSNVRSVSRELGLSIVFWSIDPSDYLQRSPYSIYSHIMGEVADRDIILLHDVYDRSVEAARNLIPSLISRGYQLVTVSELMHFSGITLEPGVTYNHGR